MAGIQEIEELIGNSLEIIRVAEKAGPNAWAFTGTTLTINDTALAEKIGQVLNGTDRIQLKAEAKDLSSLEILRLARNWMGKLSQVLGG